MTSAPVRAPLADHHRSPEDRPDIAARMRRIYEYCYPLEDTRARQAYGVPSGVTPSSRRQASARPVNLANHQDPATTLTRLGSTRPGSANDAQGEPWRAATPHQPGDLMPVDAVGIHLGQRPGDAETRELRDAPAVHRQRAVVDGIVTGSGLFHRSSLERDGVTAGRHRTCCRADADSFALRTIRSTSRASFRSLAASLGPGRVSRRPLVCVISPVTCLLPQAGRRLSPTQPAANHTNEVTPGHRAAPKAYKQGRIMSEATRAQGAEKKDRPP